MIETKISDEIKKLEKDPDYLFYHDAIVENGVPVAEKGIKSKENQMIIVVTDMDFAKRRLEYARKNCKSGFTPENFPFIDRYGNTLRFHGRRVIVDKEKALEGEKHDLLPLRLEKI